MKLQMVMKKRCEGKFRIKSTEKKQSLEITAKSLLNTVVFKLL